MMNELLNFLLLLIAWLLVGIPLLLLAVYVVSMVASVAHHRVSEYFRNRKNITKERN